MLGDLTTQLAGDAAEVRCLLSPGTDPHLYQPTPQDARLIAQADLVVTSGLRLEGWIDDLVRNAGGSRPVVVASTGVQALGVDTVPDPHFWFDLRRWQVAAQNVADALLPLNERLANEVPARLERYLEGTERVDTWVRERIASIPQNSRVLITSHDAFAYFGQAYGIDVIGVQGISTEAEASQRDVANVIDVVRRRGARAVFTETSVNPRMIQQISRETGAVVAGPLYGDSVGAAGTAAETLLGSMIANVTTIVDALGGIATPIEVPTLSAVVDQ